MAKLIEGICFSRTETDHGDPYDGFGRSTKNPVAATSGRCSYSYLKRLHPAKGGDFLATRCMTFRQENHHIIDAWELKVEGDPNDKGFLVYIDCYAGTCSMEAPRGCKLDFSWSFVSLYYLLFSAHASPWSGF